MTKPNVVVLYPDQLRALSLPLFGERQIETPNIDRLAEEGICLENVISNCPDQLVSSSIGLGFWCGPWSGVGG